ncbi:MAG: hypothetical protein M3P98_02120 [bacterium]|nr:hypothetical protein [bacterium]
MSLEDVLVEQLVDQNDRILEAVQSMQTNVVKIPKIERDLEEIKQDISAIKYVTKDHSTELRDHENRITVIEAKA